MRKFGGGLSALVIVVAFSACGASRRVRRRRRALELLNVSYDPTRELWRAINARVHRRSTEAKTGVRAHDQPVARRIRHPGPRGHRRPRGRRRDAGARGPTPTRSPRRADQPPTGRASCPTTRCPTRRRSCSSSARATRRASRTGRTSSSPASRSSRRTRRRRATASLSSLQRLGIGRAARRLATTQALDFVTQALQAGARARLGARGATTTFVQKKIGDVHLAWENEAHLEVREAERRAGDRLSADQHPRRAARRRRRCRTSIGRGRAPRRRPTSISCTPSRRRRSSRSTSTARPTRPCSPEARRDVPRDEAVRDHRDRQGLGRRPQAASSPTAACSTASTSHRSDIEPPAPEEREREPHDDAEHQPARAARVSR